MKATTVILKPGVEVPEGFLRILAEKHHTAYSYGAPNGDYVETLNVSLEPDDKNVICDLVESIKDLRKKENYFNDRLVLHVADDPDGLLEEDLQPFTIIERDTDDTGEPLIVVFAEGEFAKYAGGEFTPEAEMVEKFLKPKILELYEANGKNLAKTWTALADSDLRKSMLPHIEPRGHITLMFADGSDPLTYSKNEFGKEFPWGYTSRHWGWNETPAQSVDETPAQRRARMLAGRKMSGTVPIIPGPGTDTKIPDKVTEPEPKEEQVIRPPDRLQGKSLRKWHQKRFGSVPKEAELRKPRPISALLPGFVKEASQQVVKTDDIRSLDNIPKPQPGGIVEVPAVVPPGEQKDIMQRIREGKMIKMTAEDVPASAEEFEAFSKQIDTPLEEILLWNNKSARSLSHQSLFCSWNELRHLLLKRNPDLLKVKEPVVVAEPTEEETPAERRARRIAERKAM